MKKKINLGLLLLTLFSISSFAQKKVKPNLLINEQRKKDSIEFANFKQKNPEAFLSKRLPIKLADNSYAIQGYSTGIRITNNHIKGSVFHNFHPGMPDTSTVNPFNDIEVTDATLKIDLFRDLIMSGRKYDSDTISKVDPDLIINNKIGSLPIGDFSSDFAIRISINGSIVFDWKTLNNFPKQPFKISETFSGAGKGSMFGYNYGYNICDTSLNINDQLLIEIKTIKNNWSIERYNFKRVAVFPTVSSILSLPKGSGQSTSLTTIDQKKTSFYRLIKEK